MASSQLIIYTSQDPYGPGPITGISGSLPAILNACLVNGYGTGSLYKPPAGWSKPCPDISASAGFPPSVGSWKQGSGSMMTLFVNDANPNQTAAGKESWACGYEMIQGNTSSLYPLGTVWTASNGNGQGYGQFPLPSQLLTYGHVVIRKSNTATTLQRTWMIAADASTVYMWIQTGDNSNAYFHWGFGDIFSFGGINDQWNCFIYGKCIENDAQTGVTANIDYTSVLACGGGWGGYSSYNRGSNLHEAQPGCYIARGVSGQGGSINFTKKGDGYNPYGASSFAVSYMSGQQALPNGTDNSIYIAPLQLVEPGGTMIRGRFRGLYQVCHYYYMFTDGQTFSGGGDYSGKTFTIVRPDCTGYGLWAVETSATVETND